MIAGRISVMELLIPFLVRDEPRRREAVLPLSLRSSRIAVSKWIRLNNNEYQSHCSLFARRLAWMITEREEDQASIV